MSAHGADLLVIGVDGLDFDLVHELRDRVPTLYKIVSGTQPHASVFPPDSVPSWTTIVTGLAPTEHAQLSNVKYFLEDAQESTVQANLNDFSERCFWEHATGDTIAVVNPFLAYPPWAPRGTGAMVSGPPFAEEAPMVADPNGLLTGEPPSRMGGFSKIPKTAELDEFCAETLAVGDAQFEYALAQLRARRWDLFFFTSLVIDRVEHYTWRNYSAGGPGPLAQVIPRAHEALDAFLRAALALQAEGQRLVLLSDHGHGPRAEIGVNLHEYLRRQGLYQISRSSSTFKKRGIEWAKTMVYSAAPRLGAENAAIAFARRLPAKRALKSGSFVGSPRPDSVSVPDLAGSNPFGGVRVPESVDTEKVIATLMALTHRGKPVFRWVAPKGDVLADGDPEGLYPDLLFEMDPKYGPTWNLYGPVFSPVITRKRQSGGHTRRSVFAIWPAPAEAAQAKDSMEVHRALRHLVADASGAKGDKKSP